MKFINIISQITKVVLAAAFVFFTAFVSSAQVPEGLSIDNDFAEGEDGYYYVNMPSVGSSKTITLTTNFPSSFKVYDNGGKNGNYKDGGISTLVLTAPDGYVFKLSGTITAEVDGGLLMDYLAVYDGKNTNARSLGDFIGATSGVPKNIGPVSSSDRYMTLMFQADKNTNFDGLDLTVTVVESTPATNSITVNTVTGGNVTTDKTTARVNETVTLTATPSTGYLLKEIIVSDGSNTYPVTGGGWITNAATFTMPKKTVTVTPVFTTDWTVSGGLYTTMLSSGNLDANIPNGVQSFKVIFDGTIGTGKTSSLKLTAPEGYLMQLSGKVSVFVGTHSNDEKSEFVVYDGENTSASKLVQYYANKQDINNQPIEVLSTGKEVYISCHTGWSDANWNLDLSVTLNPSNEPHSVIVSNSISHGGIVTDKTSAKPNTTVNLTVTPDEGYVLESINVTDANGKINLTPSFPNASFGDVNYFTTSNFSFEMRTADATVSATFMPKTDFYVRIPKENQRDFTIPEGTTSFKVCHTPWGGSAEHSDYYVNNNNGSLLLTAPEGFKMEVSGKAYLYPWSSMVDYFEIFDGSTNTATSFGKIWVSSGNTYKDVNAQSSGNHLLLYFYSDGGGYDKGLNLTVTLIDVRKSLEDFSITIPFQTYNGSALTPVVTVQDGNTTLTEGTDYTVSYSDNTNVGTAKATITGIGNYKGEIEKTFTITPKITVFGALTLTQDQNGVTATIDGNYDQTDAFSLDNDIENVSVTFNRTFTSGMTSTIVLPFDIEADGYSGGEFYEFSDIDTKTWTATMSKVTSVTAHTPYLFVPNGNALTISQKVTLKATSGTAATTKNGWVFTGVYQKKVWGADDGNNKDYCFAANATDGISVGDFVKIGTYVQVKPFRCYLTRQDGISKSAEQLSETIRIRLIDETSSVITPDDPQAPSDSDITTPVSEITPDSGVKVWSFDGTIYIESQPDTDYTIIDLTGRTLLSGVTSTTRETVTLSRRAAGIVIVKIGQQTFKVNY